MSVLLATGCGPEGGTTQTGSANISVRGSGQALADITHVEVTVEGAGIVTPIVQELTGDPVGGWAGLITDIPAGTDRSFTGRAYNGGVLIYEGHASPVVILGDDTVNVTIFMQEVVTPPPFQNAAPRITGLSVSTYTVPPGGQVSLSVTAEDPDVGDTLTYSWFSAAGTFDDTTIPNPVWTAPAASGTVQLRVSVSDDSGATATLFIQITIASGAGAADVSVDINSAPEVSSLVPDPTQIDVSDTTYLDLTAMDPDGDPLTYQWRAIGCSGSFDDPTVEDPAFTLEEDVPDWTDCVFTVRVSDGRGGVNYAFISVATGPGVCGGSICGPPPETPGQLLWDDWLTFSDDGLDGDVTTTPAGRVIVAGSRIGEGGPQEIVFQEYLSSGGLTYWNYLDSDSDERVFAIATDSLGNGYIAGRSRQAGNDLMAIRQVPHWAEFNGWTAFSPGRGAYDLEIDASDKLWAVGLQGSSPYNVWVARYDSAVGGPPEWSDSVANVWGPLDEGAGLAVDFSGGVVVCTSFYAGLDNHDIWLRRYNAAGDVVWTTTYGSTEENEHCEDVAVTSGGEIIVTGWRGSADRDLWLARFALGNGAPLTSPSQGVFEVRVDLGGNEIGRSVVWAPTGSIYVAGQSDVGLPILRAYSGLLTERWAVTPLGSTGAGVTLDAAGYVYYTGLLLDNGDDFWVGKFVP